MKSNQRLAAAVLIACTFLSRTGYAQSLTVTNTYSVGSAIHDGSLSGLVDSHPLTFDSQYTTLTDVQVQLNISGGFNGDYYAYLVHNDGFAVLLNRVGTTSANSSGYADAGFNITLSSSSSANDIHLYQNLTTPPNNSPLTGIWAPDGRNVSPGFVLDTDLSTATLASFDGGSPDGTWTLFIADVSPGAEGTLDSWSLITTVVPEPSSIAVGFVGGLALLITCFQRHKRR